VDNRAYQKRTIAEVLKHERMGHPSVCIVGPTGSGKTYMMVWPALAIAAKRGVGDRAGAVVAIAHRQELINQLQDSIRECGVESGIIAPGYPQTNHLVQVASVQTLIARGYLPPATVCIWDECHHAVAPSYHEIHQGYSRMGAFHIGGTASPERSDGIGLYPTYRHIVVAAQRQQLIRAGFLVPTHVLAPRRVLQQTVADIPVKLWEKHTPNTRTIVFARDTQHARDITAEFLSRGWPTGYVDGDMPAAVRKDVIDRFIAGRIMILVNCKILTEGFNLPAIETVVLACNVGHDGLYMQMVGRAGRRGPGKKFATCLDLCGNYHVHGLPDENRKFSLRGRAVRLDAEKRPMRRCSRCSRTWRSNSTHCPHCGSRKSSGRKAMGHASERLVKVNPAKLARARQERFNQLWDHARVTGKPKEWIEQRFRAQFGVSCSGMRPTHKRGGR